MLWISFYVYFDFILSILYLMFGKPTALFIYIMISQFAALPINRLIQITSLQPYCITYSYLLPSLLRNSIPLSLSPSKYIFKYFVCIAFSISPYFSLSPPLSTILIGRTGIHIAYIYINTLSITISLLKLPLTLYTRNAGALKNLEALKCYIALIT